MKARRSGTQAGRAARPGSVRVVAGRFRGRRIPVPPGTEVRPTADRVKEALFSILGARVAGARVVDLFAGSGALGIEALSRGAAGVLFVESDPSLARALGEMLDRLGAGLPAQVRRADALRPEVWIDAEDGFDLVLADPPYRQGLAERLLAALAGAEALRPGGLVVIEHEREIDPSRPEWSRTDCRPYGDTALSFFARRVR